MMKHILVLMLFFLSFQALPQQKNYYQTLGVSPAASEDEIKLAARRMIMKYHPDRLKNDPTLKVDETEARRIVDEAVKAKDFLLNKESRATLDATLKTKNPVPKSDSFQFQNFNDPPPTYSKKSAEPEKKTTTETYKASTKETTSAPPTESVKSTEAFSKETEAKIKPIAAKADVTVQSAGKVEPTDASIRANKAKLKTYELNKCGRGFLGAVFDALI